MDISNGLTKCKRDTQMLRFCSIEILRYLYNLLRMLTVDSIDPILLEALHVYRPAWPSVELITDSGTVVVCLLVFFG